MSPFYPALFACLASAALSAAHAAPTWLTLVGDPHDPTADYIQFDPSGLARDNGLPTPHQGQPGSPQNQSGGHRLSLV